MRKSIKKYGISIVIILSILTTIIFLSWGLNSTPNECFGPSAPLFWSIVEETIEKEIEDDLTEKELKQIKENLEQSNRTSFKVNFITDEGNNINLKGRFIFGNFHWSEI